MKSHFIIPLALVSLLCATACDQAPKKSKSASDTNSSQNQKPGTNGFTYRFPSTTEKCDTYQRRFSNQHDLCLAIQVPELNNNCAEAERVSYFKQNCSGEITGAAKAESAIKHVNGHYVECTLVEQGLPTLIQYSANSTMMIEHAASKAVITHSAKDGVISIRMELQSTANNGLIKQVAKSFHNETEPVVLEATSAPGSPVLTCLVTITQDPTHD